MTNNKNISIRYKVIILVILSLLPFVLGFLVVNENIIPINKTRAQVIIDAVYTYEKQTSEFPTTLDDLKPNYLKRIPSTIYGEPFFYFTNSVDGFGIMFMVREHYGCGYTAHYQAWECSFGD